LETLLVRFVIDLEVFKSLYYYLPDPIPGDDGHYKSFDELYGTTTTEQYRPSLSTRRKPTRELIGLPLANSM